jgi:hypothetical protein
LAGASKENIDCDFERLDSYLFPPILTRLVKSGDEFCHGSRFDTQGWVINGLAINKLAPVDEK